MGIKDGKGEKNKKSLEGIERQRFFSEVKQELKKVTWPTREDLFRSTLVIIVVVIVSALLVSGLDFTFSQVLSMVKGF